MCIYSKTPIDATADGFCSAMPVFRNLSGNFSLKGSKTEKPMSGVSKKILSFFSASSKRVLTKVVLNFYPQSHVVLDHIVLDLGTCNTIPVYFP